MHPVEREKYGKHFRMVALYDPSIPADRERMKKLGIPLSKSAQEADAAWWRRKKEERKQRREQRNIKSVLVRATTPDQHVVREHACSSEDGRKSNPLDHRDASARIGTKSPTRE
jgi:hypothetical protein